MKIIRIVLILKTHNYEYVYEYEYINMNYYGINIHFHHVVMYTTSLRQMFKYGTYYLLNSIYLKFLLRNIILNINVNYINYLIMLIMIRTGAYYLFNCIQSLQEYY